MSSQPKIAGLGKDTMNGRVQFDTPLSKEISSLPGFAHSTSAPSTAGVDAIRGNLEKTPLNQAYFSPQNFQIVQNKIRYTVYEKTNEIIDPVGTDDLYIVMRSIYYQYSRNLPCNIAEQIADLNERVAAWCVPKIVAEIQMDKQYRKDISSLPVPMSHPVNINTAGTKSLPFKPFF